MYHLHVKFAVLFAVYSNHACSPGISIAVFGTLTSYVLFGMDLEVLGDYINGFVHTSHGFNFQRVCVVVESTMRIFTGGGVLESGVA